jgi:hypothetical protein
LSTTLGKPLPLVLVGNTSPTSDPAPSPIDDR